MEQIFSTFGIDWRLLLINMANFGLLLFVLWYFLYSPVMRLLEERRQRVAKGVKDAEAAAEKLSEIEASREGVLAQAGKEADVLLVSARAAASAREREIIHKGEAAAAAALKEAQAQAAELRDRALMDSKQDLAKLIVLGVERTLRPSSGHSK